MADATLKQRIDAAANRLLDLMEDEEDAKTMGGLFGQVVAWYKVQNPSEDEDAGSRLTEISGELKTASDRGKGSPGEKPGKSGRAARVPPKGSPSADGDAIRRLISSGLPKIGPGDDGDSQDSERAGVGGNGDGRSVRINGGGTGAGNYDEPGNGD